MRGVLGKHLMGLLVVVLCAAMGCTSSKKIVSVEGPLTPYSPKALPPPQPGEPADLAAPGTKAEGTLVSSTPATTSSSNDPYRYDPATVDPDLLDTPEPKPTLWDRMTEASSPKRISALAENDRPRAGRGPGPSQLQPG